MILRDRFSRILSRFRVRVVAALLGTGVFLVSGPILAQGLPSLDDMDQQDAGQTQAGDAGPEAENLDVPMPPPDSAMQPEQPAAGPVAAGPEGPVEASAVPGPAQVSVVPRFGVGLLAGAAFPVEPQKGGCKTGAGGPLVGLGASYRVADFFEVGVRVSYRYFATACGDEVSTSSDGEIPSSLQEGWESAIAAVTPDDQLDGLMRTEIEDHILLAGPLARLGYAWERAALWAMLGGGGGVDVTLFRDYLSSIEIDSGTQDTAEGYAEAGIEAALRLADSPVPLWLGLGASYLQPFPEGWQESGVMGWASLYLLLSARF